MSHFEIWSKDQLGKGDPEHTCYVIDTAIYLCEKLSVGTTIQKVWKAKPGAIPGWWGLPEGQEIEVIVPKSYALIEVDKIKTIRGWGIAGKYYIRRDCKSCANSGQNNDLPCKSCKGCSYNPIG